MQHSQSIFQVNAPYNAYYDWVDCLKSVAKQLCSNDCIYGIRKPTLTKKALDE